VGYGAAKSAMLVAKREDREIFALGRDELGFELVRMNTTSSLGCNEFVFRRPGDAAS
jgi:hypothetical protein